MADIQTRKWKDFCPLGKINVHQKSCHNSPETRVLIVFSAKVYSGSGTYSQHFNCPSFWHIDMSYSKFIFTSKFNTQYPIMTNWKMSFLIKKNKQTKKTGKMYFSQLLLRYLYICILWASSHNLFYRTNKAPGCLVFSRYDPWHSVWAFPNHVMSNQLNLPLKASYRNSWQIIGWNTIYLNAVNLCYREL